MKKFLLGFLLAVYAACLTFTVWRLFVLATR